MKQKVTGVLTEQGVTFSLPVIAPVIKRVIFRLEWHVSVRDLGNICHL